MSGRLPEDAYSAVGSWPGIRPGEAAREVVGVMAQRSSVASIPALIELPERGPAAHMWGRAAGALVDIALDLESDGWRLASRPGPDQRRARALLSEDLEAFAAAILAEGTTSGWAKIQLCGPWTLGVGLRQGAMGDGLADRGLMADVVASLAEGLGEQIRYFRELVPGMHLAVQIDEPSLTAVASGRVPTATGRATLPAINEEILAAALSGLVQGARGAGAGHVLVHTCAAEVPWRILAQANLDGVGLALGAGAPDPRWWEECASAIESGSVLWAGIEPAIEGEGAAERADRLTVPWQTVGLEAARLRQVVLTPECGIPQLGPNAQRAITKIADYREIISERSLR